MTREDLNPLYQQLGEVVRGLAALGDTIELRHVQAEKIYDLLRADVANLRQDQRDIDEKIDCVIAVMQRDLELLRTDASHSGISIRDLVKAVEMLSKPVSEIIAFKSRVAGIIIRLGVVGSALMWLAEPLYRWFVDSHFLNVRRG
jgi:hypothetical protein